MSGFSFGPPTNIGTAQPSASASSIAAFLTRILPHPAGRGRAIGIHYARRIRNPDGSTKKDVAMPGRAFYSVDDAARYATGFLSQMQRSQDGITTDLYTCMSLCGMEVTKTDNGISKLMNTRQRGAMAASKTLFADLDVKDKGYPTQQAALDHVDQLVAAGKIPSPTVRVSTGNGVHLHWVLDRELNAAEWYTLGPAWSDYLSSLGVQHDKNIASDAVRVLRLPDTFNVKDLDHPLPTALIGTMDPNDLPVSTFEALLGVSTARPVARMPAAAPAQPGQGAALTVVSKGIQLPASFAAAGVRAPLTGDSEFSSGIQAEHMAQPVNFAKVVDDCPTLKDIHTRGGAGDSGVLWGLALLAATFAPAAEARQWGHEFSNKHVDYVAADTDAKFDQKVAARHSSGGRIGWPSCKTFSASSALCAACPKLPLGKTPFHGARDDSDMPEHYFRRNGEIIGQVMDDEGNFKEHVVFPYGIIDAYMEMTSMGPVLNCEVVHAKNPPRRLIMPVGVATSWRDSALSLLGAVGAALLPHQIPMARTFFVSYIQLLQRRTADVAARDSYGWTKMRDGQVGFAFGGKIYGPAGATELAPPADRVLASRFTAVGDVANWKQAADLIMGMNRMDLQCIVAASFAAPLIHFSGQSGLMFSAFSPESGAQKSSAMKVALSVWGDPVGGMSRLDDTANHVGKKLGQLRNIPVFWDELHHRDQAEQFAKLGFALTLGTEKGRLGQNADMRESGSWATLLIVASNPGVRQVMLDGTISNSAAGVNRLLEIEVQPVRLTTSAAQASAILDYTHHNYGVAGALYAELLANEAPTLKDQLLKTSAAMENATKAKPDERFWILGAAAILLGASLANKLDGGRLIQFDLKALGAFLVQAIQMQKVQRSQDILDYNSEDFAVAVVGDYINWCRMKNLCLETDTFPAGQGRPRPVEMRMSPDATRMMKAPTLHIAQDDSLIRMTKTDFRDWVIQEKRLPIDMVRKALMRFAGLTEIRARWAAGTPWNGASQTLMQLDVGAARTPVGARFSIGPVVAPQAQPTPGVP